MIAGVVAAAARGFINPRLAAMMAARRLHESLMKPTRIVSRGAIELAVYERGLEAGRQTVVLVHGYPDSAQVWTAIAERLAERFHVVSYDVRGAGASSVPRRIRDYRIAELMADLEAVIDAVAGDGKVHLAAHDWGSIQCWEGVTTAPLNARIASYTSISGPSLDHAGFWLREHAKPGWRGEQLLKQLARSWYIVAFQLPVLAPAAWRLAIGRHWPKIMQRMEGAVVEASPTQVKDGRNGVNLYRANVLPRLLKPQPRFATLPVQLIIPTRDRFVGPELYEGLSRWVKVLRRRAIDAGHWLLLSHPDKVAGCIAEWIDEHPIEAGTTAPRRRTTNSPNAKHA